MNWNKTYNSNGIFSLELAYIEKFKIRPSSSSFTFNDEPECDVENVSDELIKTLFNNVTDIFRVCSKYTVRKGNEEPICNDYDGSSIIGNVEKDKTLIINDREFKSASANTFIVIITDKALYQLDNNSILCKYSVFESLIKVEREIVDIWEKLPKVSEKPKETICNLVGYSNGEYYTIESKIKRTSVNISEHYNDDFIPVFKDTIDFLNTRESGLILYYGVAGSGKTNLIRHLITNCPHDYIIVPTSITTRLSDPDFITFMIDNSDSVFILEDCEQILMDRSVNVFNGAISNILNMSDGLLSDIMNLKFICTFNADIKDIDPALLRKGRCYAKYEFKKLSSDKVASLNDKYNLNIQEIKPMTLAEIYNTDRTEYSDNKTVRKIGF